MKLFVFASQFKVKTIKALNIKEAYEIAQSYFKYEPFQYIFNSEPCEF